ADEPVTVGPASPGIVTTPSPSAATVGATLNDGATLSGGFSPTGTITFNLYRPNLSNDCSGVAAYTQSVAVTGNGNYSTSPGFASDVAGTWHWTAGYSGDVNNNPATSNCADEPVTVGPASPSMSTAQNLLPNDSAALSGGFNPT